MRSTTITIVATRSSLLLGALTAAAGCGLHTDGDVLAPLDSQTATPDAAPPPVEIAARQTVHFTFSNASSASADRYLVTGGSYCGGYAIHSLDPGDEFFGAPLPLALGFQCLCECAGPGIARASRYHRIARGASYTVDWDGRALAIYTEPHDCAEDGRPELGVINVLAGAYQPVAPGSYFFTFAMRDTPPEGCVQTGHDYDCHYSTFQPSAPADAIQDICPEAILGSRPFTLPASGDVQVEVHLDETP